ncbi:MAG: serine hydrolase [Oligoflexia bacterium]|nr:serine hydrolase [Oligoflexia bacterium]
MSLINTFKTKKSIKNIISPFLILCTFFVVLLKSSIIYATTTISSSSPSTSSLETANVYFQNSASFLCSVISEESNFEYKKYFTPDFINSVPYEDLIVIFHNLAKKYGRCKQIKISTPDGIHGTFMAITDKEFSLKFSMALQINETASQFLISGLFFKGNLTPSIHFNDLTDLKKSLEKLAGNVSAKIKILNQDDKSKLANDLFSYNSDVKMALGSTFKLYVLGSLADKIKNSELKWNQEFPIKEELKSLPSGVLQNQENGKMLSLLAYARYMISISDNTATDHLINIIGKEYIENNLTSKIDESSNINSFVTSNIPFLTTLEMFKFRALYNNEQAQKYSTSTSLERKMLLSEINSNPLNKQELYKLLQDWNTPKQHNFIEWFSSTNDMCNTMDWLLKKEDNTLLAILSLNTPFIDLEYNSNFEYAGYKGGSEPGVINMTYLLKTKNNKWISFSIGQNNLSENINDDAFSEIVHATLELIGKLVTSTN